MHLVEIHNQHTQKTCGLSFGKIYMTIIYEDNTTCITQLKNGYIKRDRTKHISPMFIFTHDLRKSDDIDIQRLRSCDNLLFLKITPKWNFWSTSTEDWYSSPKK